ncbi:UDP-3-O-[3-hydroxymyristoyl] glucosamine N-acyltransferase [Candidatus Koribacter versatilis Ellin345]|uniref:UDP-3-O-acylglucosamine N-acyltransferase 1 n=1 Tax=Koribacter versatilis (strain Ellin345) TaxID=204669 RepID=LPXD1_KORVE|nr:UDP-3-O-(3-hydroxymyristoyl)glucosamine N-acyltransferase [Candidatus Koribacter versatilis]Q1IQB4.1 RecName: Full=UDP-3-O-acylglucosamine N-acyltransferase 1 [Candidatus Koribacter versatilis Ellin345]ABF40936.1 UDP-3-O-[3-hydroxymyristoyl] glucosamine N-acyltransferase [Candidatus Koribacter versatilis Ellin345]
MKLSEIARRLGCTLDNCPDPDAVEITAVTGIEAAGPTDITFVSNPRYAAAAKTTHAGAIIVSDDFTAGRAPLVRSKNPYLTFAKAIELFYQAPKYAPGIHPTAVISPTAKVGANASIGPYVVIEDNVAIGANCVLRAHVVIYEGVTIGDNFFAHAHAVVREHCRIGNNVILQNGVVIGADGYGFARDTDGWYKIAQSGTTILDDNVEVQANSTVDRASIGETHIYADAKIDNLVMIGHGSSVGEHSLLCSQVGLAGSSHVGKNVILAGQVGVAGHLHIGDGVIAAGQTGVQNDIEPGKRIGGSPSYDHKQWIRSWQIQTRLPEIVKELRNLASKKSE